MFYWLLIPVWIGLGGVFFLGILFLVTSLYERRRRAAGIAILVLIVISGISALILVLDYQAQRWFALVIVFFELAGALLLLLPTGAHQQLRITGGQERLDEREAIFHRFYRLEPGTEDFEAYYRMHPEKLELDEKLRAMPDLAQPGAKAYDRLTSPFQIAAFEVLSRLTRQVDGQAEPVENAAVEVTPQDITGRLKGFARYLGADLVGTTKLNPAYVYSHIGRSPGKWGEPVSLNHNYAIAIGVEMSHDMIRSAPDGATTTETAFKYFESAKIALIMARYLNLLGYEARAHVDGNYRVLCVPVAVDAGLGELGRLGLLINPKYGPRLRLSVVTTNLELCQDTPVTFGVQHFCEICKKCATNCPSHAIDADDKKNCRGVEKWRSNQESCYGFWRTWGSDCSICVRVCPYSHPNTIMHNLVRRAVSRNRWARRLALLGDDICYGRRPQDRCGLPPWHVKTGD
jgi:Fe-S-cluster-containing hydrogenase component 2